jgi:putative transposase
MNEDNSIVRLRQPDAIDDPLTALLRSGARQLLEQAIEAEVAAFLASMKDLKLADGRDRLVRHGHGPERVIQGSMSNHGRSGVVHGVGGG